MLMPMATPMTPQFSHRPNNAENSSRAAMVSTMETIIVNFTSPAARSPLPREPAKGYARPLKIFIDEDQPEHQLFRFRGNGRIAHNKWCEGKDQRIPQDGQQQCDPVELFKIEVGCVYIFCPIHWPITVVYTGAIASPIMAARDHMLCATPFAAI